MDCRIAPAMLGLFAVCEILNAVVDPWPFLDRATAHDTGSVRCNGEIAGRVEPILAEATVIGYHSYFDALSIFVAEFA
jgi:hypothetical protein